MDRCSRLEQHDNVQKQIMAFEKLVQYAISRFSKEKLYRMLRLAARGATDDRHLATSAKLTSLSQLRALVASLSGGDANDVTRYFDGFFDDLRYLRGLKRDFDEKIHARLYEYFYDLEDASAEQTPPDAPLATTDDDVDGMTARQQLYHAVRGLHRLSERWSALLADNGELDPTLFDADSYHELLQFSEYAQVEPLLRLIPDVFVKAYKSTQLARRWWTQANNIYDFLPRRRRSLRSFDDSMRRLATEVAALSADVGRKEALRAEAAAALGRVARRSERCDALSSDYDRVEELRSDVGGRYERLLAERVAVRAALQEAPAASDERRDLQRRLRRHDDDLVETHSHLKLLAYNFDVLQQDYSLETQLRPEFVQFAVNDQVRLVRLTADVTDAQRQRHDATKRLVLMRTNCDAIRLVMLRYDAATPDRTFITNSQMDVDDDVTDDVSGDVTNDVTPMTSAARRPMRYGREFDGRFGEKPVTEDVTAVGGGSHKDDSLSVTQRRQASPTLSESETKASPPAENDPEPSPTGNLILRARRKKIKALNLSRLNEDHGLSSESRDGDNDANDIDGYIIAGHPVRMSEREGGRQSGGTEAASPDLGAGKRRPRIKQWQI